LTTSLSNKKYRLHIAVNVGIILIRLIFEEMREMKIYRNDVEEIGIWLSMIIFFIALAYIANGGSNLLVLLFVIVYSILVIIGLKQSTSEFLEEYYYNKRCERLRKEKV
jgi:hypothetical protein